MGRGRGKGKKTGVTNQEDPGSGEETLPAYKRRGRPQKPLKDDIDDDEIEKIEKADEENAKPANLNKDAKPAAVENGKKRKRHTLVKENSDSVKEENGATTDSTKANGFRQNGSRRKSKPRRAAEAGVCKLDMI